DRRVAALPREARAAAAPEDRNAMRATDRHRLYQVLILARNHDADRRLSIVGSVRRVKSAAAAIESNLTRASIAKVAFESLGVSAVPRRPMPHDVSGRSFLLQFDPSSHGTRPSLVGTPPASSREALSIGSFEFETKARPRPIGDQHAVNGRRR